MLIYGTLLPHNCITYPFKHYVNIRTKQPSLFKVYTHFMESIFNVSAKEEVTSSKYCEFRVKIDYLFKVRQPPLPLPVF